MFKLITKSKIDMKKMRLLPSAVLAANLLLSAVFLSGCDSGANGDKVPLGNRTIQTIEYDSCEYVYLRRYGSVAITHKGDCKFCADRHSR